MRKLKYMYEKTKWKKCTQITCSRIHLLLYAVFILMPFWPQYIMMKLNDVLPLSVTITKPAFDHMTTPFIKDTVLLNTHRYTDFSVRAFHVHNIELSYIYINIYKQEISTGCRIISITSFLFHRYFTHCTCPEVTLSYKIKKTDLVLFYTI